MQKSVRKLAAGLTAANHFFKRPCLAVCDMIHLVITVYEIEVGRVGKKTNSEKQ